MLCVKLAIGSKGMCELGEAMSQPYFEESVRMRLKLPKWGLGSLLGPLKV